MVNSSARAAEVEADEAEAFPSTSMLTIRVFCSESSSVAS
jgi:hypothetical protein